jgi:16S rRNA processing protein RimM
VELPRRAGVRKSRRRHAPSTTLASDERWIALGLVMGTHGVRGELRVKMHNPSSELLFELDAVHVRTPQELRRYPIAHARPGGKGLLVQLSGVDTVERAQALRGAELCVARSELPALPEGEFYHCDLEGLALVDLEGRPFGTVERVHEYPAADVLRVRTDRGVLEVPMREPYLVEIDLPGKRVVVDQLDDIEPERG